MCADINEKNHETADVITPKLLNSPYTSTASTSTLNCAIRNPPTKNHGFSPKKNLIYTNDILSNPRHNKIINNRAKKHKNIHLNVDYKWKPANEHSDVPIIIFI